MSHPDDCSKVSTLGFAIYIIMESKFDADWKKKKQTLTEDKQEMLTVIGR